MTGLELRIRAAERRVLAAEQSLSLLRETAGPSPDRDVAAELALRTNEHATLVAYRDGLAKLLIDVRGRR